MCEAGAVWLRARMWASRDLIRILQECVTLHRCAALRSYPRPAELGRPAAGWLILSQSVLKLAQTE